MIIGKALAGGERIRDFVDHYVADVIDPQHAGIREARKAQKKQFKELDLARAFDKAFGPEPRRTQIGPLRKGESGDFAKLKREIKRSQKKKPLRKKHREQSLLSDKPANTTYKTPTVREEAPVVVPPPQMAKSKKGKGKGASRKGKSKKGGRGRSKKGGGRSKKGLSAQGRRINKVISQMRSDINRAGVTKLGRKTKTAMTHAGLSMTGGIISGRTMLVDALQVASGQNIAGTVIYSSFINPLLLMPGSRGAKMAALYDQFFFEEMQVELEPEYDNTYNGSLLGGIDSDPQDFFTVGEVWDDLNMAEHKNFCERQLGAAKDTLSFPKSSRASYKTSKGPKAGFYFNRVPTGADEASLMQTVQGVIQIAIQTPIRENGVNVSSASFGPLWLKWKIRLKEASNDNPVGGVAQEDEWKATPGSQSGSVSQTNLLNWSTGQTNAKIQSNLTIPSNLDTWSFWSPSFNGRQNAYCFYLYPGFYEITCNAAVQNTGANFFVPYVESTLSQPGLNYIGSGYSNPPAASTAIAQNYITFSRVKCTIAGYYVLGSDTAVAGTAANTTIYNGVTFYLRVLPVNSVSALMTHSDHVVRSLAMKALLAAPDKTARLVHEELKRLGVQAALPTNVHEHRALTAADHFRRKSAQREKKIVDRVATLSEFYDEGSDDEEQDVNPVDEYLVWKAERDAKMLHYIKEQKVHPDERVSDLDPVKLTPPPAAMVPDPSDPVLQGESQAKSRVPGEPWVRLRSVQPDLFERNVSFPKSVLKRSSNKT